MLSVFAFNRKQIEGNDRLGKERERAKTGLPHKLNPYVHGMDVCILFSRLRREGAAFGLSECDLKLVENGRYFYSFFFLVRMLSDGTLVSDGIGSDQIESSRGVCLLQQHPQLILIESTIE